MPTDYSNLDVEPLMVRARAIGLKAGHLSEFSGVAAASISRAVNGQRTLGIQEYVALENLIQTCEEMTLRSVAPLDWKNARICKGAIAAHQEQRKTPAILPSDLDWDLMRRTAGGESPSEIAAAFGITTGELLANLTTAVTKFEAVSGMIRGITKDRNDLTALNRSEFDARRSQQQQR